MIYMSFRRFVHVIAVAIVLSGCGVQPSPQPTASISLTKEVEGRSPAVVVLLPTEILPAHSPQPSSTTVVRKPTLKPSPLPLPEPDVHCTALSMDFYQCTDNLLHMEFEYPVSWGEIDAKLSRGETGQAYEYHFGVIAGGRSSDFTAGRGSAPTDFSGFQTRSLEDFCAQSNAVVCQPMQTGVSVMVSMPEVDALCFPQPGVVVQPTFTILVDLPQNRLINGFVFSSPFISSSLQVELDSIIGLDEFPPSRCGSDSARAQYTEALRRLETGLKTKTLDEETLQRLDVLRRVAESIHLQ